MAEHAGRAEHVWARLEMKSTTEVMRRISRRGVASPALRSAATVVAGMLNRAVILVYHRVGEAGLRRTELVPRVPVSTLRTHIRVLQELGQIVPLDELVDGSGGGARPRFALTFDDDHPSHATEVLPLLTSLGAHGTFFLSGRGPLGLGPYWFELLEDALDGEGIEVIAARLGTSPTTAEDVALACERDVERQRLLYETTEPRYQPLDGHRIASLVRAGMAVGFHTVDHAPLTDLDDDSVNRALHEGRSDLDHLTGSPMLLFAYPHGKADGRVAALARSAGYRAGFTGWPAPVGPRSDRYLLGRWEPGALDAGSFAQRLALRLVRPARAIGRAWRP
jgi:peptidoglycan/xylan/chitin deacetylase (PgdA/CDA1 family)